MKEVLECIEDYDTDKKFPLFGFGAAPKYDDANDFQGDTKGCFALNGKEDNPELDGIEGVMEEYRKRLPNIYLSGPSNFNPVFEKFLAYCKKHEGEQKKYHILLVLTDGQIHDMSETKKSLVELSDYPCSIIIVGLGNEEFDEMEALDSDKKKLKDDDGNVTFRDIVQFVKYSDAIKSKKLSKQLLQELPRQFVDHAIRHELKPDEAATAINN